MDKLSQASTLRSVETLEAFMAECAFGRFISDPPNTLRSLAVRAIQRAGSFGCPSVQDAGKVLVLMAVLGENFDTIPKAQGGLFGDPATVDAAALNDAFSRLMDKPGLDLALRTASTSRLNT